MIGIRAAASAAAAVLGLAFSLGSVTSDPAAAFAAEQLVRARATAAVTAIVALQEAMQPGLDAARVAAAAVVGGDGPPSPLLTDAAGLVADAEGDVAPARRAVAALESARLAWHPDAAGTPQPLAAGELTSIAAQLAATGPTADTFADLRARGTGLPGVLEGALAALERGAIAEAVELTAQARADHDAIVAWETDLATLPVWIETTDAMIGAVEQILDATQAGDAAAAGEGAEKFAALSDDAATADRALRIAFSEGGASVTSAPLERLAGALRSVEAAREAAVESVSEPRR
ncbi:MAG TPA: hypothetical protein VEW95_07570 [Candidatus Limnocylindrales bacterium]|nr:hypothetical protein [Candidatus Limnocylindrales bacterium]